MFCFYPFLAGFSCVFLVIMLLEDPVPVNETKLSDTRHHISLHAFELSLYPAQIPEPCARCSKMAPEQNRAFSMFHSMVQCSCFSMPHFCIKPIWLANRFCLICPKGFLPARKLCGLSICILAISASLLFYLLQTVELSAVIFWYVHNDRWCNLTGMYLDLGVHL